jgi:hypothetical protein
LIHWLRSRALIALALLAPNVIIYCVIRYHGKESFVPLFQSSLGKAQLALVVNFLLLSLHESSSFSEEGNRKRVGNASSYFIERHGFSASTYSLVGQIFGFATFIPTDPGVESLLILLSSLFYIFGIDRLHH